MYGRIAGSNAVLGKMSMTGGQIPDTLGVARQDVPVCGCEPTRASYPQGFGVTAIGGIFIGFTIAPSQEIPLLAAELGYSHQLALIALSLVLTYISSSRAGSIPGGAADRKRSRASCNVLPSRLW